MNSLLRRLKWLFMPWGYCIHVREDVVWANYDAIENWLIVNAKDGWRWIGTVLPTNDERDSVAMDRHRLAQKGYDLPIIYFIGIEFKNLTNAILFKMWMVELPKSPF